jgi:actin-related protein
VRLVVVDHGAHQVAVQNVNEHVAAHDQVVRIPIGGNEFGQILGLA